MPELSGKNDGDRRSSRRVIGWFQILVKRDMVCAIEAEARLCWDKGTAKDVVEGIELMPQKPFATLCVEALLVMKPNPNPSLWPRLAAPDYLSIFSGSALTPKRVTPWGPQKSGEQAPDIYTISLQLLQIQNRRYHNHLVNLGSCQAS